jgi:TPR repeat protein
MKRLKVMVVSLGFMALLFPLNGQTNKAMAGFTNGILREYRRLNPTNTLSDAGVMYRLMDQNRVDGRFNSNLGFIQESQKLPPDPLLGYFDKTDDAVLWIVEPIKSNARNGDPEAQQAIGVWLERGLFGAKTNVAEAVKWYRRAADRGFAYAQVLLGNSYCAGRGVPKDEEEGARWYRKAADQGDSEGQLMLAAAYNEGSGVPKDYEQAAKWYREAADQDDSSPNASRRVILQSYTIAPMAQTELGKCYYRGEGVTQDFAEAARWFRRAADQGDKDAQDRLAVCYSRGEGVIKDYLQAYKWFNLASAQGHEGARKSLSALEKLMNSDQVAEAQRDSQTELSNIKRKFYEKTLKDAGLPIHKDIEEKVLKDTAEH